ncbi:MAG: 2,3-bisphosphoglycerate-independent phosphoglycerate mutase [Bacilli bacterium]
MQVKKPLILCVLDGFGYRLENAGNAINQAHKPWLDYFFQTFPHTLINASGEWVGLPDGQMGNSEVGHMNIGAGRIVYQSLTYINAAIKNGTFFKNPHYLAAIEWTKIHNSKLHILGLVSDGGVHSHINHIKAMIRMAKDEGLDDVYIHAFMDGRDVDPQKGADYIAELQEEMDRLQFGKLADIGGRYWGMDRDKNFDRLDRAYRIFVNREGPSFTDFRTYFQEQYALLPTLGMDPSDEFVIPSFNANVDGRISDNDAIIFMNFRPDRAIEISTVFTNPTFYANPKKKTDGTLIHQPYTPATPLKNIKLVATMKYADSVLGEIAFALPSLENTLGPWLADNGYHQLRIAETEKYAHVTFFFDGTVNYDGVEKPELRNCRRILIDSPKVATYDLKPEMSAIEVTDALLKELNKKDLDVVILNFANCDMVGHTAVFPAVIKAVETVDSQIGRILNWLEENGGTIIITSDHGNAEYLLDEQGKPFTAHTTNPVLFGINIPGLELLKEGGKLANIAPTIIDLLGRELPKEMEEKSLIIKRK